MQWCVYRKPPVWMWVDIYDLRMNIFITGPSGKTGSKFPAKGGAHLDVDVEERHSTNRMYLCGRSASFHSASVSRELITERHLYG